MTENNLNDLHKRAYITYEHAIDMDGLTVRGAMNRAVDLVLAETAPAPWDTLRAAADIMHPESHPAGLWTPEERALRDEVARLEAAHRAEQEKAAADAARESLIENVARAFSAATYPGVSWAAMGRYGRESFIAGARALADAGLLVTEVPA